MLACDEGEHRPRERNLERGEEGLDSEGFIAAGSGFEGGKEGDGREEEREERGVDRERSIAVQPRRVSRDRLIFLLAEG